MKWPTYGATLASASRLNYLLTAAAFLGWVSAFALSVRMAFFHERVIMIPPQLDERTEVAWTDANEAFYKSWGLYAATLFGNVTPKSAEFIAGQLSSLLDASIYNQVRQQILTLAADPKFAKALSFNYFTGREIIFEPSTKKVFVVGTLTVASYSVFSQQRDITTVQTPLGNAEQRPVVYEMQMQVRAGRPVITAFNSYPGNAPRTLRWLELNGTRLKEERARQEAAGIKVLEGAVIPLELDTSSSKPTGEGIKDASRDGAKEPAKDSPKDAPVQPLERPGSSGSPLQAGGTASQTVSPSITPSVTPTPASKK